MTRIHRESFLGKPSSKVAPKMRIILRQTDIKDEDYEDKHWIERVTAGWITEPNWWSENSRTRNWILGLSVRNSSLYWVKSQRFTVSHGEVSKLNRNLWLFMKA